jgi:hypothetical protein
MSITTMDHLRKAVEELINENSEASQVHFHQYLIEKNRTILEMDDEKEEDEKDEKEEDKEDEKEEDEKEEKVDESLNQPKEGAMSTTTKKSKFSKSGKGGMKKMKSTGKGLDSDKIEKTKFTDKSKSNTATVLGKRAKVDSKTDGRDLNLGTTE